jgi:hypothetical protein
MNWYDTQEGILEYDGIVSVYDEDGNMIDVYKKEDGPSKTEENPEEEWTEVVKKK